VSKQIFTFACSSGAGRFVQRVHWQSPAASCELKPKQPRPGGESLPGHDAVSEAQPHASC